MSLFDKVITQYKNELPFVVYSKPDEEKVTAYLMPDTNLDFTTNFKEAGFVFAPFNSDENAVLFLEQNALIVSDEMHFSVEGLEKRIIKAKNSDKEIHIAIVKKAIEKIKSGNLQKVVISREEIIHLTEFNLLLIYKNLLAKYKNAFVYVWYHPKVGLWLGATPETLLQVQQNTFKTMSLAGTQVYYKGEDIQWKAKELEEQQLVTDFIESQLNSIAHHLDVDKTETVKAGNLLHLRTKVSGELNTTSSLQDLIRALHPTPAVCGLPRKVAKEFIMAHETYFRGYYTGFLGELNLQDSKENGAKSSSLFVNLRCMEIQDNNAVLFIGGGITKDSNAEKEWEETVSKAKTMKRVL